jgi:hypothetical protein
MVITPDTSARFVVVPGRGINHCFSLAETVSILAGHNSTEYLAFYNANVKQFSHDGKTFEGHYGQRLHTNNQLAFVVNELTRDPGSRRALMTIWNPALDATDGRLDYPCNVMMMLKAVDNVLHAHVIRRSSDLVWGVPHDHVVFTVIHDTIARSLRMATGEMVETVDSLHYYTGLYDDILDAVLMAATRGRMWACTNGRPDVDCNSAIQLCADIVQFDMEMREEPPNMFQRMRQEQLRLLSDYGTTWWCDAFMVMMAYHLWKAKQWSSFIRAMEHVSVSFRSCLLSTFEPRVATRAKELGFEFVNDFMSLTCMCASDKIAKEETT